MNSTDCSNGGVIVNYWQMRFKHTDDAGVCLADMWPDCFQRGIAAIGWGRFLGDLSGLSEQELDEKWQGKYGRHRHSALRSLKYVVYCMREGHTIYAVDGSWFVGKGVVTGEYDYDPKILAGAKYKWEHYVRIDWEKNFPPFRHPIPGIGRNTVIKLEGDRLKEVLSEETRARKLVKMMEGNVGWVKR